MSLVDEFKRFAFKGNVIDLAVGVVIGAAFGKITESLVKNVIMPMVAVVMPTEQSYATWKLTIGGQTVPYGIFLADVVNFVIVAAVLFLFVKKFLAWVVRSREEVAAVVPPTKEEELLQQIRDLLQAQVAMSQSLPSNPSNTPAGTSPSTASNAGGNAKTDSPKT
ncbi:large-conductance mechanosensitive channel : Large-conductance mechanosensitive channel OS=Singulisphaera acidiphila (strain ATCC BAA-1392 / DSM 18658 / VKM B-2454 / MOB10) GN=mscL PE=3 SV=1: MscL [Tuwongella immobilis]|uniref:Large-conductance mechanosensitive channel n=1 Tax=Tuwongella immobilis TaxID=692036 RepID=A0A6C2YLZ7_9BACT|nr:large-conductance mechanosensitive channel : Large-conductance mechanosensitive channel OS=Singulisphaera acidiphila (strain ATCC BAA-1392 / DSM 18658 / VKM B-2454 / MOB10) GN=mscL PE=3 SV=1: MscL [Tuwongella immobilis]VTS01918.1 large-conductance mechanosensitive channel : Large-conductance mechanosensitive channel OS=Singulisphaera acidiphila (strain ATCC BAA-1392 / DSM 18658 / VKM B-2454 / MOB10) GN=mscL PE=3 SV=1: MscL [Tuwongella immobilis]